MNDKPTILAVDDSSEFLTFLVKLLTTEGYRVYAADSGELALSAVAANLPDLILLDVRMKGIDGLEVCRQLKAGEKTRPIPIILISGFAEASDWVEGLKLGAADYITKPFQTEELLTRVKTHLALHRAQGSLEQRAAELARANAQLETVVSEQAAAEENLQESLAQIERSRRALLSSLEDQKRAESVRLESERRFRDLLSTVSQVAVMLDLQGNITFCNDFLLHLTGWQRDEVIGRNWFKWFVAEGIREETAAFFADCTRKDAFTAHHENDIVTRTGERRLIAWDNTVLRDGQGKIVGTASLGADITERTAAEAALRASEVRARTIFENNSSAIAIIEPDSTISMVNDAYCEVSGYSREEVIGMSWTQQIPPEDLERLQEYNRKRFLNPEDAPSDYEFTFYRKDGEVRHALISVGMIPSTRQIIASFNDITLRKQASEALRKSEEKFSKTFQHIPDVVIITSVADGKILDVNESISRIGGYSKEEVLGKTTIDLALWGNMVDRDKFVDLMRQTGSFASFETTFRKKSGELFTGLISGDIIHLGDMTCVLSVIHDITERKQAEAAIVASEVKFRTLFENMAQGVFYQMADGILVDINPSGLEMFGLTRDQFIGKSSYHPDWKVVDENGATLEPELHPSMRALKTACKVDMVTGVFNPVKQQYRWMNVNAEPQFLTGEDKPYGVFVTMHDITERKQAEEALRLSEEKTRRMLLQQVTINQLALALGETLSLAEIYRTIHTRLRDMVEAWTFIVASYDDQTKLITAEYAAGDYGDVVIDVSPFPPIPLSEPGQGTQGRVVHTGQPFYTPNYREAAKTCKYNYTIEDDGSIHEELPSEKDQEDSPRSAVFLPMKVKGIVLGIMQVQSRRLDAYSEQDIELLAGMANVAAVAVQNAWLHEEALRELTERERAQDALRVSEGKFRALIENANDIVYSLTPDGVFTYVSPTWTKILGHLVSEVENHQFQPFVHPDDIPTCVEFLEKVLGTGEDESGIEFRVLHKDGNWRWFDTNGSRMGRVGGEAVSFLGIGRDITDVKRAERDYQRLFEKMLDGFALHEIICDARGTPVDYRFLAVNPAFERLTGRKAADVVGKTALEVLPGVESYWIETYGKVALTGEPAFFDNFAGDIGKHFEVSAYRPTPNQFACLFVDITERKQAEDALHAAYIRESVVGELLQLALVSLPIKDLLRKALDLVLDVPDSGLEPKGAIFLVPKGSEALVLEASRGLAEPLVTTCARVPFGKCLCGRAATSGQTLFAANVDELHDIRYAGMVPHGHYCVPMRYEGRTIGVLNVYIRPDQARDPRLDAFTTAVADALAGVVVRRQAEAEGDRLMAAIEQAGEIVIITDPNGTIQYVNPPFETATGYTREEAIGQNPRMLKSGKQDDAFYSNLWATISSGGVFEGRIVNKRKDGTFYTENATISPVRDATGTITNYVAVKRDVTEHLKLEGQLQQAQKMESVGRLAGGVAHDFNNMLAVILGYTEMALGKVDPSEPLHANLTEVHNAAKRSADLTRQLLAFARKQTVAPKILDLNETVESMLKMLRRLIGEDIDLAWLPKASLWPVKMDPSQIDQILANLCVNARDAIAGVGHVTIETDVAIFDEAYCDDHPGAVPGNFVMLAVSDDGHGMDSDTLSKLFEPFFTTKGLGEGTGLGLATVYGIVKQNEGFISVYSEPGKGTTFRIYVPRHGGETSAAPKAGPREIPMGNGETVLVAEDEATILAMSKVMLEALGYTVLTADTPDKAMLLATEHAGALHLLLTDVVMPRKTGRELANELLSICPDIKVVFMSGYTANVIAHRGVLDEGVHFIQKPFSMQTLATQVREALDGE